MTWMIWGNAMMLQAAKFDLQQPLVLHRFSESTRHFPQAQLPSRSSAATGLLQGGLEGDGGSMLKMDENG